MLRGWTPLPPSAIFDVTAVRLCSLPFRRDSVKAPVAGGGSHHTVARYVRARDACKLQTTPVQRNQVIDPFRKYIEGRVDDSHGRVCADVVQDKLEALGLGYAGSERTIWRAVAEPRRHIGLAIGDGFGRGCRSRVCGSNGITPMARWSRGVRRGCFARGWPGAAFGWCRRCATRRCRPSSPASIRPSAASAAPRRTD
jgi:hypothetical protein